METNYVIEGTKIKKKFKNFMLDIENLQIPKGFATALIGENGAGKSTLLNILAGTRLDYKGELKFFGQSIVKETEQEETKRKERVGYTGTGMYFLPNWSLKQVGEITELLFENFHKEEYRRLCVELGVQKGKGDKKTETVRKLSDGNLMKLKLATIFSRDTDLLLLDEPASPLDPLMRERLCEMMLEYLAKEEGEKTILFSTHNISDMESVTDYAIIMEAGKIVEKGFVEDLKEKYIVVKGEKEDAMRAEKILFTIRKSEYGFEGICLASEIDKLAGMDVSMETPSLFQISVAVMKKYAKQGLGGASK